MTEINKKFGNALKKARKEKKLSLREAGKEMGISYSYLSQLESGTRGLPSVTRLLNLCHFYSSHANELTSCYPEELLCFTGAKNLKELYQDEFGNRGRTKITFAKNENKTIKRLLKDFPKLPEEGQKDLLQYLDYLLSKEKKENKN